MASPTPTGTLRIPDEVLDEPVAGVNLGPGTLRDQLGDGQRLMVFLRHFGCMFCRETLADMREAVQSDSGFPRPIFFYQGTVAEGRALLRRDWPDVQAIADPEGAFYKAFGVERGNLVQMLGPAVWSARTRARDKGHRNGERGSDIWRMPGVMLVQDGQVVWAQEFRHAGEQPDYAQIRSHAVTTSA